MVCPHARSVRTHIRKQGRTILTLLLLWKKSLSTFPFPPTHISAFLTHPTTPLSIGEKYSVVETSRSDETMVVFREKDASQPFTESSSRKATRSLSVPSLRRPSARWPLRLCLCCFPQPWPMYMAVWSSYDLFSISGSTVSVLRNMRPNWTLSVSHSILDLSSTRHQLLIVNNDEDLESPYPLRCECKRQRFYTIAVDDVNGS